MTDDITIRERSKACFELFNQCSRAARVLEEDDADGVKDNLEDEFARFRLWLSNIGVFADVQLSLDFRVREIPDLRDMFLKQLVTVDCRLNQRTLFLSPSPAARRCNRAQFILYANHG
jgi:hypothetical protein